MLTDGGGQKQSKQKVNAAGSKRLVSQLIRSSGARPPGQSETNSSNNETSVHSHIRLIKRWAESNLDAQHALKSFACATLNLQPSGTLKTTAFLHCVNAERFHWPQY